MSGLRGRERLQPSLLDRLTDNASSQKREQFDQQTLTMEQLRQAVLRDLAPTLPAHVHLVPGHPIAAIEQAARKTHSAIVVMGAISRSGLRRFLFGNTAEYLLDSLPCDLLIVKPPKFSAPLQKRSRGVKFVAAPYASI